MTLIITVSTPNITVQVSDRRITEIRQDESVNVWDDEENKALLIRCKDAQLSVAFTGRAAIQGKSTSNFVCDTLIKNGFYEKPMGLDDVESQFLGPVRDGFLTEQTRFREYYPTALVYGAIQYVGKWPHQNVRTKVNCVSTAVGDDVSWQIYSRQSRDILIHGAWRAFPNWGRRRLRKLAQGPFRNVCSRKVPESMRHQAFEALLAQSMQDFDGIRSDGIRIVNQLVELIRAAGTHPRYGKYIGRSCVSTVMSSDQFFGPECRYHPHGRRMGPYTPIVLDTRFHAPLQFVANTKSDLFLGNFVGLNFPGPFLCTEGDGGVGKPHLGEKGPTANGSANLLFQAPWVIQNQKTGRLLTGTKPERPTDLMLWVFTTKGAAEARIKELADHDALALSFANPPAFVAFLRGMERQRVTVVGFADGTDTIKIYPIQEVIERESKR
jgi:hypothetical protein